MIELRKSFGPETVTVGISADLWPGLRIRWHTQLRYPCTWHGEEWTEDTTTPRQCRKRRFDPCNNVRCGRRIEEGEAFCLITFATKFRPIASVGIIRLCTQCAGAEGIINTELVEMRPVRKHVLVEHTDCKDLNCAICEGSWSLCSVCGAANCAQLPECPGYELTAAQHDANYAHYCAGTGPFWDTKFARLMRERKGEEEAIRP